MVRSTAPGPGWCAAPCEFRRKESPSLATFSASWCATARVPLAQLVEELVGREVERVFLVDAANDHRRMHAQRVHDDRGAETGNAVGAAARIVALVDGGADARVGFDNVIGAGPVC